MYRTEPLLLPEVAGRSPECPEGRVCSHLLVEVDILQGCNVPVPRTSLWLSSQSPL